jgi:flagellar basal body-associated protein FliL|tara:strand:+ start:693 stop:1019 length:327 start_codon:yes stop_codon:yes gene_type:complete
MSIRKHIEAADDALRLAIIEALEKKQDEQLETLFQALGKVRELILTTPIRNVDNVVSYYRDKAEFNFNLKSDFLNDPVGYSVNDDIIEGIETPIKYQRKDLDSLDGPT